MRAKLILVLSSLAMPAVLLAQSSGPLTWTSGEYKYDGAGNIVSIGTASAPGTQGYRTYGYDSVTRLTKAQIGVTPAVVHEYAYDVYGNRTAYAYNQQWTGVPVSGASNRFTDATYDATGNQLTRGSTSATYDGFGMLTSYRFDGLNVQKTVYNAKDERIGVMRGSEWTWSFRDSGARVLRQYRSSSTNPGATWRWVEDFVYRGGALLGSERVPDQGGRRHYHLDHLGTPRLVTGAAGAVISEHDVLPFGEDRTTVGQQAAKGFDREQPHRFTGHERDFDNTQPNDSSSYVDYMHARSYTAKTGRFLSVDPTWASADAGKPQSWNRYVYVMNNPVNLTDPDGKAPNSNDKKRTRTSLRAAGYSHFRRNPKRFNERYKVANLRVGPKVDLGVGSVEASLSSNMAEGVNTVTVSASVFGFGFTLHTNDADTTEDVVTNASRNKSGIILSNPFSEEDKVIGSPAPTAEQFKETPIIPGFLRMVVGGKDGVGATGIGIPGVLDYVYGHRLGLMQRDVEVDQD